MGPLDIFIGWQPLLIAAVVYMLTQLVKSILNAAMGGKEKRQQNRIVTRIVLPALPPLLGALAAFIPAHPQSLVDYIASNELSWEVGQLIFAAWGATCGQFSDYLYSKIKALIEHDKKKTA